MKPACPMLRRPVNPKCRLRPIAANAMAAVVGAISSASAWVRMRLSSMMVLLSADPLGAAEQALRPEQQHEDEDHECRRVPEVARHSGNECGHLDDEADHQGSQ